MKQNAILTLFILLGIILFTGCSEKDSTGPDNPQPEAPALADSLDLEIILPDSLQQYTSEEVDYDGVSTTGYALAQFISETVVNEYLEVEQFDARPLFAFELVSSDADDNWSPRERGMPDLSWQQFSSGFILPAESAKAYFPDELIAGTYNVKFATYFRLYRKIDTVLDGSITTFETNAFPTTEITYIKNDETLLEPGFPLTNLISDYVTDDQDNYTYRFIAADGGENDDTGNIFSWQDLQNGYWLTEKERAIFLNEDSTLKWKSVKYVEQIELAEID
ncbi:MAG: hypothetical protein R6U84_08550 [Candidatus Cloacimonadales bacterium]